MALAGHFWTVGPWLRRAIVRRPPPTWTRWEADVPDSRWGSVRISGCLQQPPDATEIVVLVHGLGGCSESYYAIEAARQADAMGMACLRLNLRGADRSGEDLYNGGILADLDAALESPALARYDKRYLLGYSLGGHISIRYATISPSPRLDGVAAICCPLDLSLSTAALDDRALKTYLGFLLRSLKKATVPIMKRRDLGLSIEQMQSIQSIREWDEKLIAPRFNYANADAYYADVSARRCLADLAVPTLLLLSRNDPMILGSTIEPALKDAPAHLETHWLSTGGHVGFPSSLDLGFGTHRGIHGQAMGWLQALSR